MKDVARVVEVVAHDPTWSERFTAAQRPLVGALPTAVSIEHIGSTSIPGMAAKPIIDIQAVVPEVEAVLADLRPLEQLGYVHRPLVFPDDDQHLFFVKDTAGKRAEHLHVFGVTSPVPAANRLFRAYIAADADAARRYEAAKRHAAERHPDSRARYGAAKEEAMRQLTAEARLWRGSSGWRSAES
ncbi:GrpB family protein [Micromonospora chersina]|uniref:GrpB family protein n=1 Tax=Micromonospora chersina TaxID=47854 RepID=UPI003721AEF9